MKTRSEIVGIDVDIRWMLVRDLPEVLEIEQACFQYPWNEEDLRVELSERNVIGMVAVHEKRVAGFIVYKLHRKSLEILRLAVHPEFQLNQIGSGLVDRLKVQIHVQERNEIEVYLRERDLESQLFFRANGFQAIDIIEGFFFEAKSNGETFTVYHFSWLCGEKFGTEFNGDGLHNGAGGPIL